MGIIDRKVITPLEKNMEENRIHLTCILESAIKRSFEAVSFFEMQDATCLSADCKAFFMYLGVKKDAQRKLLEKIGTGMGITLSKHRRVTSINSMDNTGQESYEELFTIVNQIASDELEFYENYAALENDHKVKSFLHMLADFSKEFLFDLKIWYLTHKETKVTNMNEWQCDLFALSVVL